MALLTVVNLEKRIKEEGVLTLSMGELRDIFGAKRLGANVRWQIAETLREAGISYLPEVLPNREREPVRLYLSEHPVKEVMRAALELSPETDSILAQAVRGVQVSPERPPRRRGRPRKQHVLV